MSVSFIRVDDRMIHGQTCTRWALEYPCDGLIAVNNAAAKNPVLKSAYKSASGKKTFVWSLDEFVEREIGIIRYQPEIVDVRSLTQQWEQEGTGANKLLVAANPEMIQEIHREMTERNWSDVDFACSSSCFVEISPKGINKGRALATVCEKLGIDLSETIAFGDQELDIPMVEIVGLGIAYALEQYLRP